MKYELTYECWYDGVCRAAFRYSDECKKYLESQVSPYKWKVRLEPFHLEYTATDWLDKL